MNENQDEIKEDLNIIQNALLSAQTAFEQAKNEVGFLFLNESTLSLYDMICSEISQNTGLISINNSYILGLPTVREVKPPSQFEAFLQNTEDFLDATVGTLVNTVANGIGTLFKGVGDGLGSLFSSPFLVLGLGILVLFGLPALSKLTKSDTTQQPASNQVSHTK